MMTGPLITSERIRRFPNWLPLPGKGLAAFEPPLIVDENDTFSKGEVVRYYPHQGYGFVKNVRGEEVFFRVAEMGFVGPKEKRYLKVGSRVGFDVAWTSSGLHVRVMKIY